MHHSSAGPETQVKVHSAWSNDNCSPQTDRLWAPPAPAPADSWLETDARTPYPSVSVPDICRRKVSQPHWTTGRRIALSALFFRSNYASVCLNWSGLQHPLGSVQLFPEDLWALLSDFFFSDFQWGAAEPTEVAMVSARGGPSLASSLHSGLWLWIQIYQPEQQTDKIMNMVIKWTWSFLKLQLGPLSKPFILLGAAEETELVPADSGREAGDSLDRGTVWTGRQRITGQTYRGSHSTWRNPGIYRENRQTSIIPWTLLWGNSANHRTTMLPFYILNIYILFLILNSKDS